MPRGQGSIYLTECKRDARTILTASEEKIIAERLAFAARRGFAANTDDLQSIMPEVVWAAS